MCAPRISPYFLPVITFTKPSAWLMATALPDAVKGNLPTLYSRPFSLQARSVRPTDATWGWLWVQREGSSCALGLGHAEHAVHRVDGLVGGDVREQGGDDVAGGVHAGHVGLI